MFLRSEALSHLDEIQDLFGNDAFCRGFVWMYGRTQFWLYALIWIFVLIGLPLAAGAFSGERYGFKWYIPRALLPVVGSWLGYKWFQSIIEASEKLFAGQLNLSQRGTAFQMTADYMSHTAAYVVALLIVAGIAWSAYFGAKDVNMFGKGQDGGHLAENWLFLLGSLAWWYMIVRTGEMAAFTFLDFRELLNNCDARGTIDLHDEAGAYGLSDVITYVHRFVVVYAVIAGCYMIYYQVLFHQFYGSVLTNLSSAIIYATAWLAYLAVAFGLLSAVVAPAKQLVQQAKRDRLDEIRDDMQVIRESDDGDRYAKLNDAQERYNKISSIQLSTFPFGWRRLVVGGVVQVFAVGISLMLQLFWRQIFERLGDWLQSGAA